MKRKSLKDGKMEKKDFETELTLNELFKKVSALLDCPTVTTEEFVAVHVDNVCTASNMAEKNILGFVQSSTNIIDADSEDKNTANYAALVHSHVIRNEEYQENSDVAKNVRTPLESQALPLIFYKLGKYVFIVSQAFSPYSAPALAPATRGLLATDHVILNHGQVTWTTPELAPPLLTITPHQREDVSALDRFNVHRCPTRRVFSGTGFEPVTKQATVRYLYHSATAATWGDQRERPPASLPFPSTSREDLLLDGYLEYPHAAKALCQKWRNFMDQSAIFSKEMLNEFFFDKVENASQVAEIVNGFYGANTVTANYVQFWFRQFRSGIFDIKDAPRTDRPVVENVDKITEIIEVDWFVSSCSIAQG
ncbi:uncharacterized protein TNCV_3094491 [Trichonephila clavipes]|nr:uncharacterized protein TNCV_3094491 [Trichonephila clavipes]